MFPNYIRAPNGAEAKPVTQLYEGQSTLKVVSAILGRNIKHPLDPLAAHLISQPSKKRVSVRSLGSHTITIVTTNHTKPE